MCNLYSISKGQQAIRELARSMTEAVGNFPPMTGVFPDYPAPVLRHDPAGEGWQLAMPRWGMPSSKKALFDAAVKRADKLRAKGKEVDFDTLVKLEPDGGTTNIRNTISRHWQPWLGPQSRCWFPSLHSASPIR